MHWVVEKSCSGNCRISEQEANEAKFPSSQAVMGMPWELGSLSHLNIEA